MKTMIRNLFKAIFYRAVPMAPPRLVIKNAEIIVCSPGGVGTTMLLKYIAQYRQTNAPYGDDHLKHLPRPFANKVEGVHFVYVIGSPEEITLSLLRRGYFNLNCCKNGRLFVPQGELDIETLCRKNRDFLNLNLVFQKWSDPLQHKNPCLFIDYSQIWEHKDKILKFCGLDNYGEFFPFKKERNVHNNTLTIWQKSKLAEIYAPARQVRRKLLSNGEPYIFY